MGTAGVWFTIAILVLLAVVGVVAAFYDRRRGREIQHDLGHPPDRNDERP